MSPNITLARFPGKPNCASARTGEKIYPVPGGPKRTYADRSGPAALKLQAASLTRRPAFSPHPEALPSASIGVHPWLKNFPTHYAGLRGNIRDYAVAGRFSDRLIPPNVPRIPAFDRLRPACGRQGHRWEVRLAPAMAALGPPFRIPRSELTRPQRSIPPFPRCPSGRTTPFSIQLSKNRRLRFEISNLRSQILSSLFHCLLLTAHRSRSFPPSPTPNTIAPPGHLSTTASVLQPSPFSPAAQTKEHRARAQHRQRPRLGKGRGGKHNGINIPRVVSTRTLRDGKLQLFNLPR